MITTVKAALIMPLYISVAWSLMVSYQLFTQTAVTTLLAHIAIAFPSVSFWLSSRVDMIVFIYAFAWVFVLSSIIPSVILGKERSVLVQFFVCLSLTFLSFVILDVLKSYAGVSVDQLFRFSVLFNNAVLAVLYLSIPYVLMLALDIRSRNRKKSRDKIEKLTESYLESSQR